MTTLLDEQRSATSIAQGPDEATADQVLSRIAALGPMVVRLAPDIEQGRRLPAELVSALKSARIYGILVPGVMAALSSTRQPPVAQSRPWPG